MRDSLTDEGPSEAPKSVSTSAAHIIAGFRYQLLQSVAALIMLAENETLLLEVSEDFSVQTPAEITDYHVKNSQAEAGPPSYSLQSKLVRECLERFWEVSQDTTVQRRLVFMARGGAAVEQEHAFPDGLNSFWPNAVHLLVNSPFGHHCPCVLQMFLLENSNDMMQGQYRRRS